jgi:hypothetical protein
MMMTFNCSYRNKNEKGLDRNLQLRQQSVYGIAIIARGTVSSMGHRVASTMFHVSVILILILVGVAQEGGLILPPQGVVPVWISLGS